MIQSLQFFTDCFPNSATFLSYKPQSLEQFYSNRIFKPVLNLKADYDTPSAHQIVWSPVFDLPPSGPTLPAISSFIIHLSISQLSTFSVSQSFILPLDTCTHSQPLQKSSPNLGSPSHSHEESTPASFVFWECWTRLHLPQFPHFTAPWAQCTFWSWLCPFWPWQQATFCSLQMYKNREILSPIGSQLSAWITEGGLLLLWIMRRDKVKVKIYIWTCSRWDPYKDAYKKSIFFSGCGL